MPDELLLKELERLLGETVGKEAFRAAADAAASVRPLGPADRKLLVEAVTAGLHPWRAVATHALYLLAEGAQSHGMPRDTVLRTVRDLLRRIAEPRRPS